jgi:putative transposase
MDAVKRIESGLSDHDFCVEIGISTATFYKYRAKYGGMDVSVLSCMKRQE